MASPHAPRIWPAAALLLLAACDRSGQAPAAAELNSAATAEGNGAATAAAAAPAPFPALTGRVVDQAELLPSAEEARLTEALAALERRTTDQLVVVTAPSLGGRSVEDYSNALARQWRIGQAGKDNGVLLVVAPNDRRTRIAVGYGLEGVLTYERAQQIVDRDLLPAFREQRWQQGIATGVDAIIAVLVENAHVPRGRAQ